MRKVYTIILVLLLTGGTTYAQRNIDWSVEDYVKPIELESSSTTGTAFDIETICKNNGPDAVAVGDTLWYQMALLSATNAVILAVPSPTQFFTREMTKAVASGDTIHFHLRFTTTLYPINSINVQLRMASLMINRGTNEITLEPTGGQANNVLLKNMVWWNPQKFGVGIDEVSENPFMSLQPNPAADVVTVNFKVVNVKSPNTVTVYDLQGKVVMEKTSMSGATYENLDISSLKAGMYMIKIKNGEIESHQKLQVLK